MKLFLNNSINEKLKKAVNSGKFRKISASFLAGIFVLLLILICSPMSFCFNTPDFYLPNSGLTLYMTCGKIERPDESKDGAKLIPDV